MQSPEDLSKERLINDLVTLRQRIDELEKLKEEKQKYEDELAQTKAMFEGLFEFAPDAILVIDSRGAIVQVNQQAERLFGYTRDELAGVDHDIVVPDRFRKKHLEDRKHYMSAPHVRRMGTALELYGRRKDGTEFPVDIALGPLQTKDEIVTLAVVRDFTERVKIEADLADQAAELRKRTVQVEEMNKELESFSYSVSHDLRAPLRAIDGYVRMILKQQGDTFDEDTKRQFDMIRDSTKKMGRLIDDILAFSRLGRGELSKSRLNMEALARDAWGELKTTNPDTPADLKIAPLPPGMGDRSLIRQVLVNLLSNAAKFSRAREVPLIEVGGYAAESENVYYVRDNGVGFDMQYYDKLFGVFQRLHSSAEFEGTGVGLAIVQRIIHRHGGRVWAEGKVDKGACFYFTLQKA